PAATAAPTPFDGCTERLAVELDELSRCFYEVARRKEASWIDTERKLRRLGDDNRQDPWPWLYLGHVAWYSGRQDPGELYRQAVEMGDRFGSATARIEARAALIRYLGASALDEAESLFAEAHQIAEEDGGPQLAARVAVTEASLEIYRGGDLERAFHLLKNAEADVFPSAPDALKKDWLSTLVRVSYPLERNRELASALQRQLTMAREAGDLPTECETVYALGVLHLTTRLPTAAAKDEARGLFEEALAAARAAEHSRIESFSRLELGKLAGGEGGREHLQRCLELDDDETYSDCLWALASNLLGDDPDSAAAMERVEESVAASTESSEPWSIYGWEARLLVHWATLARSDAIVRSLNVIDSIETLRDAQAAGSGRSGLLSRWIGPYYWLSGRLLEDSEDRRQDLELAFSVTERMRARVLLEALEASRASTPPPAEEPLMVEREEILDRKVDIQRRWIDPRLAAAGRADLRELLDGVEQEEEAVRQKIERAYPTFAVSRRRDSVSLGEIEESLEEDEALLSFQLSLDTDFYGRFAGGSWLLAVTRDGTQSYRLPGLVDLDPRLGTVLGFDRPENGIKGYIRLYQDLLADAIDDLPTDVDKLTIIADGKLHRLPFAFLRKNEDAEPLISRYQLSTASSAKLWLRWRHSEPPVSQAPALVFADPTMTADASSEDAAGAREWDLADGAALDPLPHARREGVAILRTLGGASRLLEGSEATEEFVKSRDLRRFGIIHFAAHAIIDEQKPERSAVVLARGTDGGDGRLQPREIVDLELDGRVVVLASCQTAVGEVVRGEGPMSLARAFFRAEAPVVVAGLWRLPDAGTSSLVQSFYRHLARGASVAEAMAMAQRRMIRRGASGKDWAGLVVLGNGAMVPFPGGLPRPIPYPLIAAVAAVLTAAAFLLVRRRRSLQR
ncbi:MAG: CHAT domain-containing protein, partial [Thermoanaerobaculia bacterium]